MHGNNPTREYIETALADAGGIGLIDSWMRLPGYGPHAKWLVTLNKHLVAPPALAGEVELRTYAEAKLFCAALASAYAGLNREETSDA